MRPTSGKYIVGLDHLRAVAALMVFYFHGLHERGIPTAHVPGFAPASLLEEGYIGVSLFIVITGFIFTVLTNDKEIVYLGFLKNRFLRLFPMIFLVTLLSTYISGAPRDSIFLFFNLLGGGVVFGTWTLVVEFQFYLAYPFMRDRLVSSNLSVTVLRCALLVGLFTVLRLSAHVLAGSAQEVAYWSIIGRADEFLAGIVAGLVFLRLRDVDRRSTTLGALGYLIAGTAIVIAAQHWFNITGGFYDRPYFPSPDIVWVFWPTVMAVPLGAIVCAYCLLSRNWNGRLTRAFAYVGAASFSFYMLHNVMLLLGHRLANALGWKFVEGAMMNETIVLTLVHLPLTLVVAYISYELIEKSFFRKRVVYLTAPASSTPSRA